MRRLFRLPLRTRTTIDRDADDELETLIASRVERLVARGMSPEDARAEALRHLGVPLGRARKQLHGSARRRERRLQVGEFLDSVPQDVHFVARGLAIAVPTASFVQRGLAMVPIVDRGSAVSFAVAALAMLVLIAVAIAGPARRAVVISPLTALRGGVTPPVVVG